MATGYAGYTFPNIPEKWTREERMFSLALRSLFDTIFSDQQTQDRNTESNGKRITETNTKFDKAVAEIMEAIEEANKRMDESDELMEDTIERVENLEDRADSAEGRLDAIDGEDGRLNAIEGRLDDIDGTGGALEVLDGRLDDLEAVNTALGADFIGIYPIGMTVLTTSADAPFDFGTWESELTDPDTDDPVPDSDGHYRWRRTVDE